MNEKYAFWVTLRPKSDPCRRGRAKIRIVDFKNTWSEFQKASLTAAERGKAELHVLDFKTTWSEFQKASQTATEPELVTSSCVHEHTWDGPTQWLFPNNSLLVYGHWC